ncbi:thiol-disulfide oxidoreductase DCC family protein [Arenimonas alkanexedens]
MTTATWPLLIYYDASCPLCREEMHALKAYDASAHLTLVDASAPGFTDAELNAAGIPQAELMRLIHARDAAGRWFIGVEVFELAYTAAGLPGMAALWGNPRLRPFWNRVYPWIARLRQPLSWLGLNRAYGWLVRRAAARAQARAGACSTGRCELPPN